MSEHSVSQVYNRPGATRRNLTIFSLLLICAGLLSTIIYLDQSLRADYGRLSLLDSADASSIHINHADKVLKLARTADGWRLQHSGDTEQSGNTGLLVDSGRVAPLLSLLQLPESGRYSVNDVDPESLGLTDQASTITINDLTFILGNAASGKRRYVRNDDTVFLAPDIAYPMISAGTQAFGSGQMTNSSQNIVSSESSGE